MREGWTLDQMSLRAGDEVGVGEKHDINWWRVFRVVSIGISATCAVIRLVEYFKD